MKKATIVLLVSLALFSPFIAFTSRSFAQDESPALIDDDVKFLLMYFKEEDLVVESPTRGRKSLTQVAENITVIAADDIKMMNAHTVAEVLNTVTGVQVFMTGGPGSIAQAVIQGSENRHVAVFMDGIPLNNLSDNVSDLGSIPVQNIEKIEIIKGPASSSWGSSLGGVINIITKSGTTNNPGGVVSASYGSKNTGDYRIEASGKDNYIGYYLTAGRLETDGFRPHNEFTGNNAYAKLSYDITNKTQVLFTLGYDNLSRGVGEFTDYDLYINNKVETLKSAVMLKSSINQNAEWQVSLWKLDQSDDIYNYQLSSGSEISKDHYKDSGYGVNAKLSWKHEMHNVVVGTDVDSKKLESNTIADGEQSLKKMAYYLNDTISINHMSLIPGIRYDRTDTNGNFTSPSLGLTYRIADSAIVRANAARGFSIPPLAATYGDNIFHVSNPDLKMERVRSYQVGAESTAVPNLWMKISIFRHDIEGVIKDENLSGTTFTSVNGGKERRQGLEIEMKTKPLYHASIIAGAVFIRSNDLDTGDAISNIPQKTYDVGLQYDDKSLKALIIGHYIYWNSSPTFNGKYGSFIVDINIDKEITLVQGRRTEAYLSLHNIFDGSQYFVDIYKNPQRWFEAGLRYVF